MVMEVLIANNAKSAEILECIGIDNLNKNEMKHNVSMADVEIDGDEEEVAEEEFLDCLDGEENVEVQHLQGIKLTTNEVKTSWVLKVALEKLGVAVNSQLEVNFYFQVINGFFLFLVFFLEPQSNFK